MNKNKKAKITKSQLNLTKALESLFGGRDVFPQKFPDGGPILPMPQMSIDSTKTTVLPHMGDYTRKNLGTIGETRLEMQQSIDQLQNITPNDVWNTGKTLYNLVMKDKAYGGITQEDPDVLKGTYKEDAVKNIESMQSGLNTFGDTISMVPGIGTILGTGLKMFANMNSKKRLDNLQNVNNMKSSNNIYGNFANGGLITNGFKQYNTGSHNSGMDQAIDQNGVPNNNAKGGYIQNQENSYNFGGNTYVMSDTLVNPETGNLFNQDASKLNKKYKNADKLPEERNAIDFGMARLSKLNDGMRDLKEQVIKACGGYTKKMADGGPTDPRFQYTVNNEGTPLETFNENLPYNSGMLNLPIPTFTAIPQDIATDNTQTNQGTSFTPGKDLSNTVSEKTITSRNGKKVVTQPFNSNTAAIALKGLGLAKSLSDALTDPQKESVITPDYSKSDKQIYSANIDYTQARQDALAAANLASNVNRSSSSGFQSFQGRQAMNFANLADQLGNIGMQENNQRSQLALQRGQYETNKAVDTANRKYQNRIDNQMNQATADLADQKLFSELTQIGTTFNEYQYYKDALQNNKEIAHAKIKESAAILGTKYENFGFDKEFIDKVSKGDYEGLDFEQAIKFIATGEQLKKAKKDNG